MKHTILSLILLAWIIPVTGQDTAQQQKVREFGVNLDVPISYLMIALYDNFDAPYYLYFALDYKQGQPSRLFWYNINYTRDYYGRFINNYYNWANHYYYSAQPVAEYGDTLEVFKNYNGSGDRIGANFGIEWRTGRKVQFIHGPSLNYGVIFLDKEIHYWYTTDKHHFFDHTISSDWEETLISTFGLAYKAGGLFSFSKRIKLSIDLTLGYTICTGMDILESDEHTLYRKNIFPEGNHSIIRSDFSLYYRF